MSKWLSLLIWFVVMRQRCCLFGCVHPCTAAVLLSVTACNLLTDASPDSHGTSAVYVCVCLSVTGGLVSTWNRTCQTSTL